MGAKQRQKGFRLSFPFHLRGGDQGTDRATREARARDRQNHLPTGGTVRLPCGFETIVVVKVGYATLTTTQLTKLTARKMRARMIDQTEGAATSEHSSEDMEARLGVLFDDPDFHTIHRRMSPF